METLRYHTLEELRTLSLRELQALWELVPTDRQRAYKVRLRARGPHSRCGRHGSA